MKRIFSQFETSRWNVINEKKMSMTEPETSIGKKSDFQAE